MIPPITAVRMTGRKDRAELPLLVLGPALGTSATTAWSDCAGLLTDAFDVLAWDLPGHGHNRAVPDEPFTMSELAAGVLTIVDEVQHQRADPGEPIHYAGSSVGGAVGLQLLLDSPERLAAAVLLGTGARLGDELIRAPLETVADGDRRVWTEVWAGLAAFDVRDRLSEIRVPVLAVAGAEDDVTPPSSLREIADGVPRGSYAELDGVAHLAPAEAPAEVAALLRRHFLGEPAADVDGVLSDDFHAFVAEHARGDAWTRPGLDRRSRSLVTLAVLVALGQHEALVPQVKAARANGVTVAELRELLLHTALHTGLPQASTAFRVAQQALADLEHDSSEEHP